MIKKSIYAFLNHNKTALLMIVAAVILPIQEGLQHGHINWQAVAAAAIAVVGSLAKSAIRGDLDNAQRT